MRFLRRSHERAPKDSMMRSANVPGADSMVYSTLVSSAASGVSRYSPSVRIRLYFPMRPRSTIR